jgi:hypothetical protein
VSVGPTGYEPAPEAPVVNDERWETDREVIDRIDHNLLLLLSTVQEAMVMMEKFSSNPIMATMSKMLGKG